MTLLGGLFCLHLLMGIWAGFFGLFLADLSSRLAGKPIPFYTMLPFLAFGVIAFIYFSLSIFITGPETMKELFLGIICFFLAIILLADLLYNYFTRNEEDEEQGPFELAELA